MASFAAHPDNGSTKSLADDVRHSTAELSRRSYAHVMHTLMFSVISFVSLNSNLDSSLSAADRERIRAITEA